MKRIDFTPEQIQYIINNYTSTNKTIVQLAKEFNCSKTTIERRLKENNITLKPKFPYQDLTGNTYGKLTVLRVNQERYNNDLLTTNKPHRYWTCLCECGRIIDVESSHLKNGHTTSCGCIKSNGEQKITKILQENNIDFTSEITFKNLKGYGNGYLRFDFGVLQDNKIIYLIEYNGKQHYEITNGWCTEEEFNIRQINDKKKIDYCKIHNLPLIIIPYTRFNTLTIEDLKIETTNFLV